jgi:alpha-glucosidase
MIAPDKDAVFTLYEDDGMTLDYKKKMYCKTKIDMKVNERVLLKFSTEGNYTTAIKKMVLDVIHQAKAPYWIMKNKEVLPHYLHRSKFEAADHGWYYSQRLKSVQIKYLCPKEDYEVAISFEQFDLLGM